MTVELLKLAVVVVWLLLAVGALVGIFRWIPTGVFDPYLFVRPFTGWGFRLVGVIERLFRRLARYCWRYGRQQVWYAAMPIYGLSAGFRVVAALLALPRLLS